MKNLKKLVFPSAWWHTIWLCWTPLLKLLRPRNAWPRRCNVIKAILIKFGGEITLDGTFIAAAESPTCTLNHEILSNGEVLRFWVEEVEEGDDE